MLVLPQPDEHILHLFGVCRIWQAQFVGEVQAHESMLAW